MTESSDATVSEHGATAPTSPSPEPVATPQPPSSAPQSAEPPPPAPQAAQPPPPQAAQPPPAVSQSPFQTPASQPPMPAPFSQPFGSMNDTYPGNGAGGARAPAPFSGQGNSGGTADVRHHMQGGVAPAPVEGRFRLPPGVSCPGSYTARAKTWDFRPTQGGDVMLSVIFELKTGVTPEGKDIWADFPRAKHFVFTDKAEDRSYESLRYMGWNGNNLLDLAKNGGGINQEIEATVRLSTEWEDPNGKKRDPSPEIGWINPLNGIRGEEIPVSTLEHWATQMKKRREAKLAAAKPSDAIKKILEKTGGAVLGDSNDDIPF